MADKAHFGPGLFEFLADLALNNDREWFQAHKSRYQAEVLNPLVEFVTDFGSRLKDISPHMVADPRAVGGSIFRIYRDVRFSNDKTPYKTQSALHFRHSVVKEVHGPGYYLHLAPGEVFGGGGMWRPDSRPLGKIRDAIVASPERWRAAISSEGFIAHHRLEGDSLKRPPRGYDADHPLIEDLKRKDLVATRHFEQDQACAPDFIDRYAAACRESAPFMEFLTTAVGLPW